MTPRGLEGSPGLWRERATAPALIVESWSQGFLVAALLIMACITIANMRAGMFLHKLILLEVSLELGARLFISDLTSSAALPCNAAWNILLLQLRWVWVVPIFNCSVTIPLVDRTQHGGLVEDQTILDQKSKQYLHCHPVLVGASYHTTNRQQLFVLQQYQGFVCQGQALRASSEVGRFYVLLNQRAH
jgi:hypothetical protein